MERILMSTKRKHMKSLPGSIFPLCDVRNSIFLSEAPLTSEDMMSHVTEGLIDVLRALGELTVSSSLSLKRSLSGASISYKH